MVSKALIQLSADIWVYAMLVIPWGNLILESTGSMVELLATFKKDLCQHMPPRIAAANDPVAKAGYCQPMPLQEIFNTDRRIYLSL